MSFFSKQPTPPQESVATDNMTIRTMQDDLDALTGVIYQDTSTSAPAYEIPKPSTPAQPQTFTPANDNPFVHNTPFTNPEPQTFAQPVQQNIEQAPAAPLYTPQINITGDAPESILIEDAPTTSKAFVAFVIIIIIALGGGGYYYFTSYQKNTGGDFVAQEDTSQTKPIPVSNQSLFSTTTPNYLPIDTASANQKSLQELFIKTAAQVDSMHSTKPIEFFITDANNTSLSFTSFAKLAGITPSQATLNALGERFSLFIYTDQKSTKLGLFVDVKDKVMLQASLREEERTLPQSFAPLFIADKPGSQVTFTTGMYKNTSLRYTNIKPETALSFDYAVTDKKLVIGTSMGTHHALLDIVQ